MTSVRREWSRGEAYVGGRWLVPHGAATVDVEDPATEEPIGTAADCTVQEVDTAVAAAGAAFPAWNATPVPERIAVVRAVLDQLEQRRELLVETTVAEVGAPLAIAREAHVDSGLAVLAAYLDEAEQVSWEQQIGSSLVLREGVGVVACITPWNYPLYQVLAKVGGVLLSGSAVVLKPAELTPLSAYLIADACAAAGLPAGVLNLVPGTGRVVGEAMVTHPGVDAVSFTGSTAVGARVAALASRSIKRVGLELGGKSASIVLEDADFATAVPASIQGGMLNSGQTCSAWSRLLVPADRYDEAVEYAVKAAAELVVGDPRDELTRIGPVVSAAQRRTVTGFIERALEAGAEAVTGGPEAPLARGHFVAPTVLVGVAGDAEVVREEVFGPVVTVQSFVDESEAIGLANGVDHGLHGAVWSGSDERALAVARRLRTGQVDLNGAPFNPAAPFGGYGRSGNGRELGRYGIEEFLETKSVQR